MSSKNRKMQRKLKREENQKKLISELRMASLGFVGWENQQSAQIGKTGIIVEALQSNRDKVVGLVYQSLAVPKNILDRLHENTSYVKLLNRTE